jgi:hypothetical protein
MDHRKLDAARRTLGVDTETEAIDLALDFVAFRRALERDREMLLHDIEWRLTANTRREPLFTLGGRSSS